MMCFIHYISATRRLTEVKKTITMYGEEDAHPMMLGQRDFLEIEKEYFYRECIKWNYFCYHQCTSNCYYYWRSRISILRLLTNQNYFNSSL